MNNSRLAGGKASPAPPNNMLRISVLILLVAAASLLSSATAAGADGDGEIGIGLALSKPVIELGGQASLTITITGPSGLSKPEAPEVDGLDIIAAGRTQSVQIINGKVTSSKIFGYRIQPHRAGKFTIGPARIKRRGQTYMSNAVILKVTDYAKAPIQAAGPEGVMVEGFVDNAYPYVGQQVTLVFRFAKTAAARVGTRAISCPSSPTSGTRI